MFAILFVSGILLNFVRRCFNSPLWAVELLMCSTYPTACLSVRIQSSFTNNKAVDTVYCQ